MISMISLSKPAEKPGPTVVYCISDFRGNVECPGMQVLPTQHKCANHPLVFQLKRTYGVPSKLWIPDGVQLHQTGWLKSWYSFHTLT